MDDLELSDDQSLDLSLEVFCLGVPTIESEDEYIVD